MVRIRPGEPNKNKRLVQNQKIRKDAKIRSGQHLGQQSANFIQPHDGPANKQITNSGPRTPAKSNARPRRWRVSLIRNRAQVPGNVDVPSREVAEAAAANAFSLTDEQRKRLVVQERG